MVNKDIDVYGLDGRHTFIGVEIRDVYKMVKSGEVLLITPYVFEVIPPMRKDTDTITALNSLLDLRKDDIPVLLRLLKANKDIVKFSLSGEFYGNIHSLIDMHGKGENLELIENFVSLIKNMIVISNELDVIFPIMEDVNNEHILYDCIIYEVNGRVLKQVC